jgi:hypothetical protein
VGSLVVFRWSEVKEKCMFVRKVGLSGGLCFLLLLGASCNKGQFIPNTKVADSPVNREVLNIVEKYRNAMEHKDIATIVALTHPTYQHDSGTPDPADDIDYAGLRELLSTRFKHTNQVRCRIEYHDLEIRGETALVDAWIDAAFVYENPDGPPRWQRFTDYNRFQLVRDGNTWRFISGL